MSFDRSVIVITGIGREGQVGEAIARAFAAERARIVVVDRLADQAEARAATLRSAGASVTALSCDLAEPSEVDALAARVAHEVSGELRAVIAVAGGYGESGPVAESSIEVWQRQIAINLTTAYLTARAFLPLLRAGAKRDGDASLLFFSSEAALPGARIANKSAYAVAKTGVATLMHAIAQEERANNVRVNALAPTAIRTASNVAAMGEDVRYVEREEVARAALYLCSSQASAITGQLIRLS